MQQQQQEAIQQLLVEQEHWLVQQQAAQHLQGIWRRHGGLERDYESCALDSARSAPSALAGSYSVLPVPSAAQVMHAGALHRGCSSGSLLGHYEVAAPAACPVSSEVPTGPGAQHAQNAHRLPQLFTHAASVAAFAVPMPCFMQQPSAGQFSALASAGAAATAAARPVRQWADISRLGATPPVLAAPQLMLPPAVHAPRTARRLLSRPPVAPLTSVALAAATHIFKHVKPAARQLRQGPGGVTPVWPPAVKVSRSLGPIYAPKP